MQINRRTFAGYLAAVLAPLCFWRKADEIPWGVKDCRETGYRPGELMEHRVAHMQAQREAQRGAFPIMRPTKDQIAEMIAKAEYDLRVCAAAGIDDAYLRSNHSLMCGRKMPECTTANGPCRPSQNITDAFYVAQRWGRPFTLEVDGSQLDCYTAQTFFLGRSKDHGFPGMTTWEGGAGFISSDTKKSPEDAVCDMILKMPKVL